MVFQSKYIEGDEVFFGANRACDKLNGLSIEGDGVIFGVNSSYYGFYYNYDYFHNSKRYQIRRSYFYVLFCYLYG